MEKKLSPTLSAESGTSIAVGYSIELFTATFLPFLKNTEYERKKQHDVKHLEKTRNDRRCRSRQIPLDQRDEDQTQGVISQRSRQHAGRFGDSRNVGRKPDEAPFEDPADQKGQIERLCPRGAVGGVFFLV